METDHETARDNEPPRPLVVITGIAGLIGERVARELSSAYQVVGLDVERPDQTLDCDWIEADLTSDKSVANAFKQIRDAHGPRIASVVHLAAYYEFTGEPSPLYDDLTVEGTRRVLAELRGFQVEQFVFSSSLLVMKPLKKAKQTMVESSPTEAEWAYPQSKLAAERVIHEERGDVSVVVLRIAGVYDEMCHSLPISQQISRIRQRNFESHVFPGHTDHGQALVHLDDLIDCFRRVVDRRKDLGEEELFLVAEPDVMTYSNLQDRIGELLFGDEWTTIEIPKWVAKAGAWVQNRFSRDKEDAPFIKPWMIELADDHYAVDMSKARDELGWEPAHRLRDTLDEMIANLKRDPRGWYEENNLPLPADSDDASNGDA